MAIKCKRKSNSIIKMNMVKEFMSTKRWENKKVEVGWKKTKRHKKRKNTKKKNLTSNQTSTLSTNSRTSKKSTRTAI